MTGSTSELEHDLLKGLNRIQRATLQNAKHFDYVRALEDRKLTEDYLAGNVALILDLDRWFKVEESGTAADEQPAIPCDLPAGLVLYADAGKSRVCDDWENKFVLVHDVGFVQNTQDIASCIPSRVGFYVGDPFEEFGSENIYFSAAKRIFKFLRTVREGEPCPFGRHKIQSREGLNPCVVESGAQIVDSISCGKRDVSQRIIDAGKLVLDRTSSVRVLLDDRGVSLFNFSSQGLHVLDVLRGPIDL